MPNAKEIAEVLTMHSFEIESVDKKENDELIDVKVLPNRAHDCLCHRGIGKEVTTLFGEKFIDREVVEVKTTENESDLDVKIDDPKLCPRYMGKRVENISVKNSPDWLKQKLEVLGERSINNVVDITNFVMLDLGQPMHAFDADKVKGGIHVRLARKDEKIVLLTGEEALLDESVLLIADNEGPLAIAGIKGGKRAEVTESTKNIILESANFNPTMVRKTSQKIGIKNNSSKRYENEISPELTELAMNWATRLVSENASDENTIIYKTEDIYPRKRNAYKVGISLSEINKLLGIDLKEKEVVDILKRTSWQFEKVNPVEKIKEAVKNLLGRPYKLGASVSFDAPNMFDCSSFTAYLFTQAGISLPRMSVDQYAYSQRIKKEDLSAGDLTFTNTGIKTENGNIYYKSIEWMKDLEIPEGVDHVGLYLGEDKIIHASSATGSVVIEKFSESKYFAKPVGYGRIAALNEERFVITVPSERLDLKIKEDLVEEIGRIHGYEKIKPALPKNISEKVEINKNLVMSQKIRLSLVNLGYSEVYNYAFRTKGEVEVENPMASDKAFLRNNLKDGLTEALEMNYKKAPLLGLSEVKIFEIGAVFSKDKEQINVAWGAKNKKELKVEECGLEEAFGKFGNGDEGDIFSLPQKADARFKAISQYPFVLRDIAVWTPKKTKENDVLEIILENAGDLLVNKKLFDRFEKPASADGDEKISYAFNLVFQSGEKTLTDIEINEIMQKITAALNDKDGWQVR